MLRLLIALVGSLAIAAVLLLLRNQQLQLRYEINALHAKIQERQETLWQQQIQIAVATAPAAIEQTVAGHDLVLLPPGEEPPADAAEAPPRPIQSELVAHSDWD